MQAAVSTPSRSTFGSIENVLAEIVLVCFGNNRNRLSYILRVSLFFWRRLEEGQWSRVFVWQRRLRAKVLRVG